jgi:hypothetical protein
MITHYNTASIDRWPVRLAARLQGFPLDEVLNDVIPASQDADDTIAAELKLAINDLKNAGMDTETGRVDYTQVANSEAFKQYLQKASLLRQFNPWRLHDPMQKLAFWINLYNALMIHAVIAYGIREKVTEVRGIFDRAAYIVGGQRLSLNDIEHGILRANRRSPLSPLRQFVQTDPRRAWSISRLDPRIHFALVCAARSCPPIKVYDADQLHLQLDRAAYNFINNGGVIFEPGKRLVTLSRIFLWYAEDFGSPPYGIGGHASTLKFIARYMLNERDVFDMQQNAYQLAIRFSPYDWTLNV